jgi:tRNA (cytidine/uridine-2'-O-)-methyltransferase
MSKTIHLALFEPEIAANVGATVRLAAGLGMMLHLVEPFGFVYDERKLGRSALDYHRLADVVRHGSFATFDRARRTAGYRLVLLSTRADSSYTAVGYRPGDVLLAGRESSGVTDAVREAAELAVRIPLAPGARSLNVVTALAMVAGEALRQVAMEGER